MTWGSSRRQFLRDATIAAAAAYSVSGQATAHQTIGSDVTEIDGCTTITEPGQYALVTDIIHDEPPHICITIESDDVTLDGRGHSLIGTWFDDGLGDGFSIRGQNVEVKRVRVSGMETSFSVHGDGAIFDDVNVTRSGGFQIRGADETTIRNSVISQAGTGVLVNDGNGHLFENNAIAWNGGSGIEFRSECSQWIVQNNTISHTVGAGLQVSAGTDERGGEDILIRDNVVAWNRGPHGFGPGIAINRMTPARARNLFIARNTIVGNNQDGLFLRRVDDSRIARNVIVRNGEDGIDLVDSDDNIVKRNIVLENSNAAITSDSDSTGNRVWGNFTGW